MSDHPRTQNLSRLTFFGFFWQYASVFTEAFLRLFVLAILARLLSPKDFGLLGMASIFVGLAALSSQLGVGPAIVQRSSLTPNHVRAGFTLSVFTGLVILLILWISAPFIARFFHTDGLASVVKAVSLSFVFDSLGVVAEALLRRDLQFKKLARINIEGLILGYASIGILLAWLGFGVWALVGATLGRSLSNSILLLLSQRHPMKPLLSRRESRDLLYFGGGFTLARLFNYAAMNGDYTVVGRVLGAEAVGTYTRAYQLMMLPASYFGQVLNDVLFPVMAKIQNEARRLTRTYLSGVAITGLVSAPLSVLMVIMAPEIVTVLLGSKWSDTIVPFQILSIGIFSRVSYKMDDSLARALGAMYRRSVRDAIYAGAVVSGAWIGLHWGLPGAASGVLCAVILNHILAMRMSLGLLRCPWPELLKAQVPGVLLSIVVILVAFPTRSVLYASGVPSLFILIITTLVSGVSLAGLFLLRPQIVGAFGINALFVLFRSMPEHLSPRIASQWLDARMKRAQSG